MLKPNTILTRSFAGVALSMACAGPGHAINLVLDYTYDTQNFFGAGNPDGAAAGAQAKAALEAAATFFSDLLTDTFDPISTPAPYFSQLFSGQVTWSWSQTFTHPGNGSPVTLNNGSIAQDEYRIFAGGRSLGGTTLGQGGPGGFGWSSNPSGGFTSQEIDELNAITDAFSDAVETRGEPTGFSRWGGAITFDNDSSPDWHYDHTTEPTGFDDDFFSVALHELGHALGLGASSDWNALLSSGNFTGANAVASFGGPIPASTGHWAAGTDSVIYGTSTPQEAAMDPDITNGDRKLFTALDVAALDDIGWDIAPIVIPDLPGDYNANGQVEQGDLDLVLLNWGADGGTPPAGWTNDLPTGLIDQAELDGVLLNWGDSSEPNLAGGSVPEPGTLGVLTLAGLLAGRTRRRGSQRD